MEMKTTPMSALHTRASFPLRFYSIGVIDLTEIVKRSRLDRQSKVRFDYTFCMKPPHALVDLLSHPLRKTHRNKGII